MVFTSMYYIFFIAFVFVVYWKINFKLRGNFLLAISLVFYYMAGVQYIPLLIAITLLVYFSAIKLHDARGTKCLLFGSVFLVLIPLLYFKYGSFFVTNCNLLSSMLQCGYLLNVDNVVLPLGLSFYTFTALAYIIDVYNKKIEVERNYLKLATGIIFFPCISAGPIQRIHKIMPQIYSHHDFDYEKATYGLKRMAWGYFKKLVIADTISLHIDKVYSNVGEYSGLPLLITAVLYSIQIYCDFSGYSDIAIGTAKLFGIDLEENFKSPYFSSSFREFWARWHISLSTWFRDYLYIPLGGNRCSPIRHKINLLITFLVSGFWHGANWTFVFWGGDSW